MAKTGVPSKSAKTSTAARKRQNKIDAKRKANKTTRSQDRAYRDITRGAKAEAKAKKRSRKLTNPPMKVRDYRV